MESLNTREPVESLIKGTSLEVCESEIASLVVPQVRIMYHFEESSTVGATHFGGVPDVPKGWVWPVREMTGRKVAYSFLGQINCADLGKDILKKYQAPSKGTLYFFLDDDIDNPEDFNPETTDWDRRSSFRVLYTDDANLVPLAMPKNIPDSRSFDYTLRTASMSEGSSIPFWMPDEVREALERKGVSLEEVEDDYRTLFETLQKNNGDESLGRMFGHAQWQQEPEELTCEVMRERIMEEAGEEDAGSDTIPSWLPLLEYCDERYGEKVYFMIRSDDLAQHRFDRCWMVRQGT